MRLFVAIEIPEDIRGRMHQLQNQLDPVAQGVRWVAPDKFHMTLKFLGNPEDGKVSRIQEVLRELGVRHEPFSLDLQGVGAFPSTRRPRVLWVGVCGDLSPVKKLARAIDRGLESLGCAPEGRPFSGHLTLGRLRQPKLNQRLEKALASFLQSRVGHFRVENFCLFKSELRPEGPIYHVLDPVRLQS